MGQINIMKSVYALLLFAGLAAPTSAFASGPEGYPGYLWGTGTRDVSDLEGWGTMGVLQQGVKWTTLPGDIGVVTYGTYSWRTREQNYQYYEAYGPGLGVEFIWDLFKLGAEYDWTSYPSLQQSTNNVYAFLSWYKRFDFLSPKEGKPSFLGIPVVGFPTETWGEFFDDFSQFQGAGSLGWISQGIDWFKIGDRTVFDTLAIYRWRFRSQNQVYFNANGPGVGAELRHDSIELGAQYNWLYYPSLDTSTNGWFFYLTWYFDWDLKK